MFRFRLEPVLRLRTRRRDAVRRTLAAAVASRDAIRRREEEQAAAVAAARAELAAASAPGSVDVQATVELRSYLGGLRLQRVELDREAAAAEEALEACRAALVEADRDVKTLERLRDRRRDEWEADRLRREDREATDGWAAAAVTRAVTAAGTEDIR